MNILAIQKHHNSSACLLVDGELVYYNQEERLSRIKKHYGFPLLTLKEIQKICSKIDLVAITGYDFNYNENVSIANQLKMLGFSFSQPKNYWFSPYKGHHLSHLSRAYTNSGFKDALVIVFDGRGSMFNLSDGSISSETTSVYHIQNSKINCLYKKLYTHKKDLSNLTPNLTSEITKFHDIPNQFENTEFEITNSYDLGLFYDLISINLGFDEDECGKLMGLQSYGNWNSNLPNLVVQDERGPKINMEIFTGENLNKINYEKYPNLKTDQKSLIDLSFHAQKAFEEIGLNLLQKFIRQTNSKNIILTGGAALNVVANNFFRKNLPKEINIHVEPLCGDEGNSIGIAQLYHQVSSGKPPKKIESLYICGNNPSYDLTGIESSHIIDANESVVVELLEKGNIVAIFQGKAEAGPRALGNRSILFDPRIKNGKDIVNEVKQREPFRPFACSIMAEHAKDWFDMGLIDESPFMMYAVNALDGVAEKIPSVIHVDNTCRVQTVKENQNSNLYNLLKVFNEKTGVPLLFNTSFNLAGDSIVETLDDAINTLKKSKIEYLYLPEIKKVLFFSNHEKN